MTISGFFSRIPNINMSGIFSEKESKICSKFQLIFNYTICSIMFFCSIMSCFIDTTFIVVSLFCVLIVVNYIYTFVIAVLSRKIRRRILINTMKDFLENNEEFSSDEKLVKQFCREYRQVDIKEAKWAFNNVKKK